MKPPVPLPPPLSAPVQLAASDVRAYRADGSMHIEGFDDERWKALESVQPGPPWQSLPEHIHRTSAGRPWPGLSVWHQMGPVGDLYVSAHSDCIVLLRRGPPTDLTARVGPWQARTQWRPREAVIVPGGMASFWRSSAVRDNVHISLAPAWLQKAAGGEVTLAPSFARRDPVLMGFADLLLASLDNNVSLEPAFGEHMATAIALHLIQNYAVPTERARTASALSSRQVREITDAVLQRMDEPWPVARLAAIADLSPFHFSRAFKRSFGTSPHAWVHMQRMERAAQLVRGGTLAVAEIAACTGYASAAHFTHAFRRHWGITPSEYRRS